MAVNTNTNKIHHARNHKYKPQIHHKNKILKHCQRRGL